MFNPRKKNEPAKLRAYAANGKEWRAMFFYSDGSVGVTKRTDYKTAENAKRAYLRGHHRIIQDAA